MYDPALREVVYSENGIWKPINMDFNIFLAEQVAAAASGTPVSVLASVGTVAKFGANAVVGNSAFETVAQFQGTVSDETFVSTNAIGHAVSSSASDVGLVIQHEGHTIDGFGNLTFVDEPVTLNGTTPVALTTPRARQNRAYVAPSGVFNAPQTLHAGTIHFYNSATTTVTGGVPNTASSTKMILPAGQSQSEKAQTATASDEYLFLAGFTGSIGAAGGSATRVEVRLQSRDIKNGGVWRPVGKRIILRTDAVGIDLKFSPYKIVSPNHDIRVIAKADSNSVAIEAEFYGYTAKVVTA